MNGDIWVESVPGEGSNFSFTAEFELVDKERHKYRLPSRKLEGLRVMVIDDNDTARNVLKRYLESFSFHVDTFGSGEDALNYLRKSIQEKSKLYDLILMDWKMPGMDGIETTVRLKKLRELKNLTVIMITAYKFEEAVKAAESVGIDGILVKPISPSSLFDEIISVFGYKPKREVLRAKVEPVIPAEFDTIQGAKILLVEDNEMNQMVAKELLQAEGFWVTIANDGEEALTIIFDSAEIFDVVLMDLQMPRMDGYKATSLLRKNEQFKKLPVIALTADAIVGVKNRCKKVGMNDYLAKPIEPKELYNVLLRWIKPGVRKKFVPSKNKITIGEKDLLLPPKIKGIDLKDGLQRVNGNKTLYISLLKKFKENNQNFVNKLNIALDKNNIKQAERMSHSLKGVSGNIGAKKLFREATLLNNKFKEKELKDIPNTLDQFSESLNEVIASISQLEINRVFVEQKSKEKKETRKRESKSVDPSKVKSIINKLQKYLKDYDTDAISWFQKKRDILEQYFDSEKELQDLEKYLAEYEFEKAVSLLKQFKV